MPDQPRDPTVEYASSPRTVHAPPLEDRALYLDLLKRCLTGMVYQDPSQGLPVIGGIPTTTYVGKFRQYGRDWPSVAHSGIGLERMHNLQRCIEQVLAGGVPGDFIETGVWRGGAIIFMRGVLAAHGVTDRTVWAADSFEGLPTPDTESFPLDAMWVREEGWLAVDLPTVQANVERYGLLDDQVRFLKGWFEDTLPAAPIGPLAILRLDGDLYASTMTALVHLYPKVSRGGFVIVDDYNLESCRQAVTDFRATHAVSEPIVDIDGYGVYWRKA